MKTVYGFLIMMLVVGCTNLKKEDKTLPADTDDDRIKVYLLGTFHFAQTDSTYDVQDAKHQNSIGELNDLIVGLNPNKIFIERMPDYEYQNKIDSTYTAYLNSEMEVTNPNEIWQIAFKVAKRLAHPKLYQCDHPGRFGSLYGQIEAYAQENDQTDILTSGAEGITRPMTQLVDVDSLRESMTVLNYFRWLNSKKVQGASHAHYISLYPKLGHTDVYDYKKNYLLGSDLTVDWYRRNIKIYTKMINQLDYKEEAIFLLMGNDHIPIIKHLFESNPYFKVMDTESWLN